MQNKIIYIKLIWYLLIAIYRAVSQIEVALGISSDIIVMISAKLISQAHRRAVPGVWTAITIISLIVLIYRIEFTFSCCTEIISTHFVHVREILVLYITGSL